jgi:hypothetical protein
MSLADMHKEELKVIILTRPGDKVLGTFAFPIRMIMVGKKVSPCSGPSTTERLVIHESRPSQIDKYFDLEPPTPDAPKVGRRPDGKVVKDFWLVIRARPRASLLWSIIHVPCVSRSSMWCWSFMWWWQIRMRLALELNGPLRPEFRFLSAIIQRYVNTVDRGVDLAYTTVRRVVSLGH